jgi:hypothetical protein
MTRSVACGSRLSGKICRAGLARRSQASRARGLNGIIYPSFRHVGQNLFPATTKRRGEGRGGALKPRSADLDGACDHFPDRRPRDC